MSEKIGEIFTLDEVAKYLKVGKRTIYRLVAENKLPAFKVGGAWRFTRADIDSWIKQQSMEALEGNQNDKGSTGHRPKEEERK